MRFQIKMKATLNWLLNYDVRGLPITYLVRGGCHKF